MFVACLSPSISFLVVFFVFFLVFLVRRLVCAVCVWCVIHQQQHMAGQATLIKSHHLSRLISFRYVRFLFFSFNFVHTNLLSLRDMSSLVTFDFDCGNTRHMCVWQQKPNIESSQNIVPVRCRSLLVCFNVHFVYCRSFHPPSGVSSIWLFWSSANMTPSFLCINHWTCRTLCVYKFDAHIALNGILNINRFSFVDSKLLDDRKVHQKYKKKNRRRHWISKWILSNYQMRHRTTCSIQM